MADISDVNTAQSVKIIGSDSTGVEQTPVNSTSNGGLHSNLRNTAGVETGITSNPLRIDPVGTTPQPASQSGVWTVQPGNTPNTAPWLTTISHEGNNAVVTSSNSDPSSAGLVVRPVPYKPPTFSVMAPNVATANLKTMIALQNTGSSIVRVKRVFLVNERTVGATGVPCSFSLSRITSTSGGTALTPSAYDTTRALPAGITASTNSTPSGTATVFRSVTWSTDEWGPGTLDVEALDHGFQTVTPMWESKPDEDGIVIRPSQCVLVSCNTNTTTGIFNVQIIFTTESV